MHVALMLNVDVRNWFSNIEQHASEGVNKILIGNKCDMEDKRVSDKKGFTAILFLKRKKGHYKGPRSKFG